MSVPNTAHFAEADKRYPRMDAKSRVARNEAYFERMDAASPGGGVHFARALEHVYSEVTSEQREPRTAMRNYPTVSRVPIGAKEHTVSIKDHRGGAAWHRGRSRTIPRVDLIARQQKFNIRNAVIGYGFDPFDVEANRFANANGMGPDINILREFEMAAQDGLEEFINRKFWFGDTEVGLHGVLNYPWTQRVVLSQELNDLDSSFATARAHVAQLHAQANGPGNTTGETFSPDTVAMTPRYRNYLSTIHYSEASTESAFDIFKRQNPYIRNIVTSPELVGAGPGGEDIVLMYRNNDRAISLELSRMGQQMPAVQDGLDTLIIKVATSGGVIQREPLHNSIGLLSVA